MVRTPNDDVEVLASQLLALAQRLERRGDDHWAAWVRKDTHLVSRGDAYGLTHFLSAFGGMGSLGDALYDDTEIAALANRCYDLAAKLKREVDRS